MRACFLFILSLFYLQVKAQGDTTYTYLDSSEYICSKDTATFVKIFYKNDGIWYLEKYSNKTRYILQETTFSEEGEDLHNILSYKVFADSGILYKRVEFVRGVKKIGFYYYPSGAIRGTCTYNELGDITEQIGFDENGGATRSYYFEKAPELSGTNTWRKHVYQSLRTARLYRNNAPNGNYRLRLQFYVEIDGSLSDITVDKDPGYGIKEEALRLLRTAGKWDAGIVNGYKVRLPMSLVLAFTLERQMIEN